MKATQKAICTLLVLTILGLYLPEISFCGGSGLFASAEKKTITEHEPKILSAPEQDIPMVAPEDGEPKSSRKYLWMGLGAAALIGLIAAVVGSGSSGSGDDHNDEIEENPDQGNISASW
jgi:hypothetical protein